jgi:hypothetical protein
MISESNRVIYKTEPPSFRPTQYGEGNPIDDNVLVGTAVDNQQV